MNIENEDDLEKGKIFSLKNFNRKMSERSLSPPGLKKDP